MRGSCLRPSSNDERARLAPPKAQLARQPPALTRLELHPEFPLQVAREGFTIPNTASVYASPRRTLEPGSLNLNHLSRTQAWRTPGRSASLIPAKPSFSKRWTQLATVRGASGVRFYKAREGN